MFCYKTTWWYRILRWVLDIRLYSPWKWLSTFKSNKTANTSNYNICKLYRLIYHYQVKFNINNEITTLLQLHSSLFDTLCTHNFTELYFMMVALKRCKWYSNLNKLNSASQGLTWLNWRTCKYVLPHKVITIIFSYT